MSARRRRAPIRSAILAVPVLEVRSVWTTKALPFRVFELPLKDVEGLLKRPCDDASVAPSHGAPCWRS
jgi:hypothetical protein